MAVIIRCYGAASEVVQAWIEDVHPELNPAGKYLQEYDPETYVDFESIKWTDEIADAKRFDSAIGFWVLWDKPLPHQPTRDDGMPNIPIRGYNLELIHV